MGLKSVRVLASRLGALWELDWEPSLEPPGADLTAALLVTAKEHSKGEPLGLAKEHQLVFP